MTKPVIVTRLGKGSELTFEEGDANFTNLRDATISVSADAGAIQTLDLNDTLSITGGTGIATLGDATDTNSISINLEDSGVTAGSYTNADITVDAKGRVTAAANGAPGYDDADARAALSGTNGIDYNNTTGVIKLTNSGLPAVNTGNVTSIDGDTDYIYVPSVATLMMSYQITFTGTGLMGTNIMPAMYYWIINIDYANNRFQISDTMGGMAKDLNSATGLTDVVYTVSMGGGMGSNTYKLQYNSSSQTVSWVTETTTSYSLTSLTDVSIMPPVTDGYVLTYDSMMSKWQAKAVPTLGYTAENTANKGGANGYASLDANGLVPSTQLPSYVDDVLEYADQASFPVTGESGKIYVAQDTGKTYRWGGSAYVEISASPGSTDSVTEGSTNLYFTTQRARNSVSAGTGISYDSETGVITSTITQGITSVSADVAPQLGGNLTVGSYSIVSTANGNINITPNGTGKTVVKNINYYETPYALTYASTITPNVTNGTVQTVTLTGNVTFSAFTSPIAGQSLTLIVKQDATGSRTLTSTMKWAGGTKTLSTAANSVDIISVFYDGTTYWASLGKDFK